MAQLLSEISDHYCFSSLYPVSFESKDYPFYYNRCWKREQYLVYIYSVPLSFGASVMSVRQQCSEENGRFTLKKVPYKLKP